MPVISSGSFRIYSYSMGNPGTLTDGATVGPPDPSSWYCLNTGTPTPLPCSWSLFGPFILDTSADGTGWDPGAPPPGFTLKTRPLFTGPIARPGIAQHLGLNNAGSYNMSGKTAQDISGAGAAGGASVELDSPTLTLIEVLLPIEITVTALNGAPTTVYVFPKSGVVNASVGNGPSIEGGYDIVAWWWVLPDITECGDKNTITTTESTSRLVLSIEQPPTPTGSFGEFEKLDPLDSDAAPQPVILSLEPDHGQPGQQVIIKGDGFGDGANVQFDGVDASDIVVVSRYQISCTAPVHGSGYANVAVINVDGVSS